MAGALSLTVDRMTHALILFAHGARDPRWAEPFQAILARVRALQPELRAELAFLELMSPALPDAAEALVTAGCTHITVQPLFLGTGSHLRRDLPALMDQLRGRFPQTTWQLAAAIGEAPSVMEAMARAAVGATGLPEASSP